MELTKQEIEKKCLKAMDIYYNEDITLERAADDEELSIYHIIDFMERNKLPHLHCHEDLINGKRLIRKLKLI